MAGICGSDLHVFNAGEAFGFPAGSRLGHEFIGHRRGGRVRGARRGVRRPACCRRARSPAASAPGAARGCRRRACAGRCSAGRRASGSTAARCRGASRSSCACRWPTPRCTQMPEALAGPEREATLLPLVDVMSTGWHGLTSAGAAPGQSVVVDRRRRGRARGGARRARQGRRADRLPRPPRRPPADRDRARRHADRQLARRRRDQGGGHGAHRRRGRPRRRRLDLGAGARWPPPTPACARGGTIACLGMDHFMGKTPSVNWFDQFLRNISVTGGLVPGKRYFPELLALAERGDIDPAPMISHRLPLDGAADGYRMMADRAEGVVKVALQPAHVTLEERLAAAGQGHLARGPRRVLGRRGASACGSRSRQLDLDLVGAPRRRPGRRRGAGRARARRAARRPRTSSGCRATSGDARARARGPRGRRGALAGGAGRRGRCWPAARGRGWASTAPRAPSPSAPITRHDAVRRTTPPRSPPCASATARRCPGTC